jgi:hypothetical protein
MKKLVLMAAVVCSVSLFSCGNADKAAEATDSVAVDSVEVVETVDTVAVDTVAVDSVAAPVAE